MNIYKLSVKKIVNGIIAFIHIPLLLVVYVIKPFIKIKFGYLSTGRVGHFGLDLTYAIAANNNKIIFYYLQDDVSNTQLEIIAKRELNVNSYYRYFVYAYIMMGLSKMIVVPHRHSVGGSCNIDGATYYSKYEILLLPKENAIGELYLKQYGWIKREKFVCLNVRDGAFFNETEVRPNSYRNSDIDDYEIAVNHLLDMGYWVVRTGKKVEKPFKIKHNKLIDYGVDPDRSDLLDIWFCKNCDFFISTGTGIDSVAAMFKKPILIVNLLPIAVMYSWINCITVPKKLFWSDGKELTLIEHLDNSFLKMHEYKEKRINIVDLDPDEIKSAVQEMIARLNGTLLTNKQIQDQNKFWSILEHHRLYNRYHGVRDPNASIGNFFLHSNPCFLS